MKRLLNYLILCFCPSIAFAQKWTEVKSTSGDFVIVKNLGGQSLGYSPASGVKLIIVDGWAFKDLNKNGKLDKYEDWRLSVEERAKDLASQLSVEQIAEWIRAY